MRFSMALHFIPSLSTAIKCSRALSFPLIDSIDTNVNSTFTDFSAVALTTNYILFSNDLGITQLRRFHRQIRFILEYCILIILYSEIHKGKLKKSKNAA